MVKHNSTTKHKNHTFGFKVSGAQYVTVFIAVLAVAFMLFSYSVHKRGYSSSSAAFDQTIPAVEVIYPNPGSSSTPITNITGNLKGSSGYSLTIYKYPDLTSPVPSLLIGPKSVEVSGLAGESRQWSYDLETSPLTTGKYKIVVKPSNPEGPETISEISVD